jgi:excisionase family DNA binding protein
MEDDERPPKTTQPAERLLTAADVAERLRISKPYAYVVMRKMRHIMIGRLPRVRELELQRFMKANEEQWEPAPEPTSRATTRRKGVRFSPAPVGNRGESPIRPIQPRTKPRPKAE